MNATQMILTFSWLKNDILFSWGVKISKKSETLFGIFCQFDKSIQIWAFFEWWGGSTTGSAAAYGDGRIEDIRSRALKMRTKRFFWQGLV